MNKQDILNRLIKNQDALKNCGLLSLAVLGSSAYPHAESKDSIKLLVSFENSLGPLELVVIKDSLENLLGGPVELLTRYALPILEREKIVKEAVEVFLTPQIPAHT